MKVAVGSTNPVKIAAAQQAFADLQTIIEVEGFDVASGISAQPRTDEETKSGAQNRARAALAQSPDAELGIGFEGGVYESPALAQSPDAELGIGFEGGVYESPAGLMNTVWCCLVDRSGQHYEVSGARFVLPQILAEGIRAGKEMGPLLDTLLTDSNVKQKQGMIGSISKGYITRTEEYASIAKLTAGLWHGRDWAQSLKPRMA